MIAPTQSTGVRLVLAVLVVVAGVGIVTAHGSFDVNLVVQERAIQDASEQYLFEVTSGGTDEVPEPYRSGPLTVNYTVFVDGEPVDSGGFELGYLEERVVEDSHTFTEPGFREMAVNVTFSASGGEWTRKSRSTRLVEVVEPGTEAALAECNAETGSNLVPPYRIQCYLTHRGLAGLLPGLLASPVVAVGTVVIVGVLALGIGRYTGFGPLQ